MGGRIPDQPMDRIAKTEAIPYYDPQNTYDARSHHTLHHRGKYILTVYHPSIKKAQRRGHNKYQGRRYQQPGNIRLVIFALIKNGGQTGNENSRNGNHHQGKKW